MKNFALAVVVIGLLSGCDGGFRYHGHISSSAGIELTDCTEQLEYKGGQVAREPIPIDPPDLNGGWTVAPFDGEYTLVLTCRDHAPHKVHFKYGSDVLPDKDPELGDVTLKFTGGAPNNSFKPSPLRGLGPTGTASGGPA